MIRSKGILMKASNAQGSKYLLSKEDLFKLQHHLVKMYQEIEKVCKSHNLQCCLAFGNVIGIMRHGGWIPWDDDLDIHMPRKDYEKFLKIYANELPDNYKVYSAYSDNPPINRFAKVIDTSTVFVPMDQKKTNHSGVFIDIFPIDNIGKHSFANFFKKGMLYIKMYIASSVLLNKESSAEYKSIMTSTPSGVFNYYFRKAIGSVFSCLPYSKWFSMIENSWIKKNETGYVHVKSSLCLCGKKIPSRVFYPFKNVDCEFGRVSIPNDSETYLNIIYGNWKEIPNEGDKWHHYVKEFYIPKQKN